MKFKIILNWEFLLILNKILKIKIITILLE